MTILDKIVKDLRGVNWSSFVSFDEREARAIKRASRKWPVGTLGYIAAQAVRPTKLGKDTQPLSYGDDAYYIREAILGRHYRRGVYRVDETKKAPAPKNEGLTPPGEALQLAAGNTRRENGCLLEWVVLTWKGK